jgi:DNA-binding response OmpR family regulator
MARVLVIEDEPSVAHIIRLLLEGRGHEVLVADDGSRGVATAMRRSPDAILLDLMMPFMDGFSVLEALRDNERTAGVPVMVLSALRKESVEERCYGLGAKQYVRKPFDPDLLVGSLEDLMCGYEAPHIELVPGKGDGRGNP